MKFLSSIKSGEREKPALIFLLKLLILLCLLKCIFFYYNKGIAGGWDIASWANATQIILWSLLYDTLFLSLINLPFFLLLLLKPFRRNNVLLTLMAAVFALLNSFCILLNIIDIFYYRFHQQRADADLIYVLKNPFKNNDWGSAIIGILVIALLVIISLLIFKSLKKIIINQKEGNYIFFPVLLSGSFCLLFFFTGTKKMLPTYPLTVISSNQLPLTQNSLHTFIYSLYRRNESIIYPHNYMSQAMKESLFSFHKTNGLLPDTTQKNVVLFIMESIPEDFFNSNSRYKVTMPFLDALVNKSTYYSNAFSYSLNSNKGITAILAGIPTITEIPLYHSNFTSIPVTKIGNRLAKSNYNSAFFIGDHYDDFGFAQCCNWLGIKYYCMEDIPGYKKMEKHAMGIHDEYVLNFTENKIGEMKQPFLAVNYNTSTHYPNELPKDYVEKYPEKNFSAQMKSMSYYNECLERFFKNAATQSWYKNTIFIFCADHWMFPDFDNLSLDAVQKFHIPVFIYDPENEKKTVIKNTVSQLDILNTILAYANDKENFISYGKNLADNNLKQNRIVFCRENNLLYQAIDSSYVLGFNALTGKPEFCYNYKKDSAKKNNLLAYKITPAIDTLILNMKAFLQTATEHYNDGKR